MKIICTIISIGLLLVTVMFTYAAKNNNITFIYQSLPTISVLIYSLIIAGLAFLSGFMLNQGKIENYKSATLKQLRKAEKAGIDTKDSLDKIDRLNAKIETLEVALQEAIKNKKN